MPKCKEKTINGKRCKSNAVKQFNYCFNHSPDCSICFEKLVTKNTQSVYCGHEFHTCCIEKWLESSNTCPLCRRLIDHEIIIDDSISVKDVDQHFTSQLLLILINLPDEPIYVRVFLDRDKKVIIKTSKET